MRLLTPSREVPEELMDVSNNGFRAIHSDPWLQPAKCASSIFFVGQAEVVSTQLVAGPLQSGFRVVRRLAGSIRERRSGPRTPAPLGTTFAVTGNSTEPRPPQNRWAL